MRRRWWTIGLSAIVAVWLLYALSLDLRFDRFPGVLMGALQILAVVLVAAAAAVFVVRAAFRFLRRVVPRGAPRVPP